MASTYEAVEDGHTLSLVTLKLVIFHPHDASFRLANEEKFGTSSSRVRSKIGTMSSAKETHGSGQVNLITQLHSTELLLYDAGLGLIERFHPESS